MTETATAEIPVKKEPVIEVAMFKLVGEQKSGFIQEGTEKLPDPIELMFPGYRKVINKSHYRAPDGITNVYIQYVNGSSDVHVKALQESGQLTKANPKRDMILFKDGFLTVGREGKLVSLVDYLRKSSFCGTNKERDKSEPTIWVEVFPEVTKSDVNEKAFLESEAVGLVRALVKKVEDGWEYEEEKLAALCSLVGATSDSPAGMVNVLVAKAKHDPKTFIEKVNLFEKQFIFEIKVAEELGVISFDDTAVGYVAKEKLIVSYPAGLSEDKKRERLAGYFQSFQGQADYTEFQVEVQSAKNKK